MINDREVQNRILHTEQPHTAEELQKAANFINDNYVGSDLLQIRERLIADLDKTRDSMNQAMHDIIAVAHSAMDRGREHRRTKNTFWPVRRISWISPSCRTSIRCGSLFEARSRASA